MLLKGKPLATSAVLGTAVVQNTIILLRFGVDGALEPQVPCGKLDPTQTATPRGLLRRIDPPLVGRRVAPEPLCMVYIRTSPAAPWGLFCSWGHTETLGGS